MNMCEKQCIIHINKTKPIAMPIPIYSPVSSPTNKDDVGTEYDLMEHFFDPTKSSPPNEFMMKLKLRMTRHHFNNLDNLTNE